jgi:hypothetical protein
MTGITLFVTTRDQRALHLGSNSLSEQKTQRIDTRGDSNMSPIIFVKEIKLKK